MNNVSQYLIEEVDNKYQKLKQRPETMVKEEIRRLKN